MISMDFFWLVYDVAMWPCIQVKCLLYMGMYTVDSAYSIMMMRIMMMVEVQIKMVVTMRIPTTKKIIAPRHRSSKM